MCCGSKILKKNLKTVISTIRKTKLKTTLVSWSAKIQPILNKIRKTFRKQAFKKNFGSILKVFHSFFNFG